MPRPTIRAIEPRDIPSCAAMISGSLPWSRYGMTQERAADRLSVGIQQGGIILVAVGEEDELLGLVWVIPRGAFDLSPYIRWIVVSPTQQGGGIGLVLLEAAEAQASQIAGHMFLLCADFNVDAQRFYERHGYQKVGAIPEYVVLGVTEILYFKRLS